MTMQLRFRIVAWICIVVCAVANCVLAALHPTSFLYEVRYATYASECLILAIWGAWGLGSHVSRLNAVAWVGILWMASTWVEYAISRPRDLITYHPWLEMLTVAPLAFAITVAPLVIMRTWDWRFYHSAAFVRRCPSLQKWLLAALAAATATAMLRARVIRDDLLTSVLVGGVLGPVALILAITLSLAFLARRVNLWWLLATTVLVPLPGLALASVFTLPGPGAGPVYYYVPAVLLSLMAMLPVVIAFVVWRIAGIRSSELAASELMRHNNSGQAEPGVGADSR